MLSLRHSVVKQPRRRVVGQFEPGTKAHTRAKGKLSYAGLDSVRLEEYACRGHESETTSEAVGGM